MALKITFILLFTLVGWFNIQYLQDRLVQHNITNELLNDLVDALRNNKENSDMRDEEEL